MSGSDPSRHRHRFGGFPPGSYGDQSGGDRGGGDSDSGGGDGGDGGGGGGGDEFNPDDNHLPEWAGFFRTPQRLNLFYDTVAADLKARGLSFRLSDGVVTLRHKDGHEQQCGLLNLMQQCAACEIDTWSELIGNHFGIMERTQEDSVRVESALRSFDAVRKRLVVRLWDRDHLTQTKLSPVAREDIPGLLSTLALDLPEAIRSLTPNEIASWGKSEDELFEIARRNIAAAVEPEIVEQDLTDAVGGASEGGARILIVQAESYYVASMALVLDKIPQIAGAHGTFLSMPVRHMMLAVPLDTITDVRSLNALLAVTAGVFRDGPGSISPRAYWHDGEAWHEIVYEASDQGLSVTPPQELIDKLQELAEEAGDPDADGDETDESEDGEDEVGPENEP